MNKYEVLKTIGEGAYGVVLQCRNKETNELVAIKRFKESDEDELVRKTTLREVKILRLLKDEPYVVKLLEAFRRKGKLYLVMDYVGCNLLDVLEEKPQGLDPQEVCRMVYTMLLGIRACHINGVIHRDIKPENLLIHKDRTLRLCDFGFARVYTPGMNDLTDYVATRWYRSPELLLGTTDYGLASDMWAVGCIMAELIDGQAIFPCETEVDQIFMVQKLLGNLTPLQVDTFNKNPRFRGYALKDVSSRGVDSALERKFGKKAGSKAVGLLKMLLVIDPAKRCTVDEALDHPFFEGLAELYAPHLAHSRLVGAPFARPPSTNSSSRPPRGHSATKSSSGGSGNTTPALANPTNASFPIPDNGLRSGTPSSPFPGYAPTSNAPSMFPPRLGSASRPTEPVNVGYLQRQGSNLQGVTAGGYSATNSTSSLSKHNNHRGSASNLMMPSLGGNALPRLPTTGISSTNSFNSATGGGGLPHTLIPVCAAPQQHWW